MIGLLALALAAAPERFAVVVGTNEGVGDDAPLRFADRDAERVAHVLADLGDVPAENVVALRNVDAERVGSALDALAARIERRAGDAETLLFFYYSGHADAGALHLQGTRLPFTDLVDRLQAMPVDVRVLVVDACQSGELTRLKGAEPAEPFAIVTDDRLDSEGLAVITSSSLGEDAQESDRLQGGVFTHHFLAGLMGAADRSADGRVTLTEAHAYARDATIRATSAARFVQHPSFATELRGGSDLVLTRVDDPGSAAALELVDAGTWLVFEDRTGVMVAEATLDGPARLVLPRGDYLVRVRLPQGIREGQVSLGSGESWLLAADAMSPVAPGATVRKGLDATRRSATAVLVAGGLVGPTTPGTALGTGASLGLGVDLHAVTVAGRLTGSYHQTALPGIQVRQGRVGGEASGTRKSDLGALSLGVGVRAGLDVVRQGFETLGEAPPRRAVTARVGPQLSFDLRLSPRQVLSVVPAADIQAYRRYDPVERTQLLTTLAVPTLSVELASYVR